MGTYGLISIWQLPITKSDNVNWAKIGDVCKLPLSSDRLQKLTETYVVSNQKVKKRLEFGD